MASGERFGVNADGTHRGVLSDTVLCSHHGRFAVPCRPPTAVAAAFAASWLPHLARQTRGPPLGAADGRRRQRTRHDRDAIGRILETCGGHQRGAQRRTTRPLA